MKILHIITSLKIGGAESALYNFLKKAQKKKNNSEENLQEMANKNLPTHYVAYFYDGPNRINIENLGIKTFKINGLFFKYDIFAYFKLKKLIKKLNPDLIHGALWTSNIFARILGKKFKIPVICDLHSNFSNDGKLRIRLEKFFLKYPATYVAVSSTAKKGFEENFIYNTHYPKKYPSIQFFRLRSKITRDERIRGENLKENPILIQNGINFRDIQKRAFENPITKEEFNISEKDFVIGAVGRLEPIKSYDILIRAFALFKQKKQNTKLLIIGDGSERTKLESLAAQLGVKDSTIFAGFRQDSFRFYPIFDCFALSSKSEGLSISLLEALSFNLPIITTHNDLNHDVITHGKDGYIVPVGDYITFAKYLELVFETKKQKIGTKKNTDCVINKFSIDNTFKLYSELYFKLVNKNV